MPGDTEPVVSLHGQWDISASPRRKLLASAADLQPSGSPASTVPAVRAGEESYQKRMQGLSDTLRARLRLGDDEILKALKASPLTAPHAEARAREIVGDLITADYRSSAQRAAEQLAIKDASIAALQREVHAASAEAAEGRKLRAQLAAETSRRERLTIQAEALRRDVDDRAAQRKAAEEGLKAAQRSLADAQARLAAAEGSAAAQALQLEKLAREKETGLEQRERDLTSLEETFRAHVAESSARLAEASEREDRLVATHAQTRKDLSEARAEIESLQAALHAAQGQAERQQLTHAAERDSAQQTQADLRELETLFRETERDHKALRDKYVAVTEQLQLVSRDASSTKAAADRSQESAKQALQEAEKDLQLAQTNLQQVREQVADRNVTIKKLEHRLDAAEGIIAQLRKEAVDTAGDLAEMRARAAAREPGERRLDALEGELERVRRDRSDLATDLAKAKASIAASEQQVREGQQQLVAMAEKLEKKRWKKDELKAAFVRDHEERFRMHYRQQQMELQSRVQELEAQNRRLLASQTEVSSSPADYLPRADHQRILSSRLEALTSEHKIELGNRLNQAERELRWRFETQATERESAAQAELRQAQQEHMNERRRLEDQLAGLQHRLQSDHSRSSTTLDTLRQQHTTDLSNLSDQLAATQQQARTETARLSGRLESTLAEAQTLREDLQEVRARSQELAKQAQQAREQLRVASVKAEGLDAAHSSLQTQCETLQARLEHTTAELASQQSQRSEAASAALQAERAERTSLAERLAIVVRERDGIRHDVDALRAELTACNTSHDCEIQGMAADHQQALRDVKRSAEERASELKSHARRELDAVKAELAAAQTKSDAGLKEAAAALHRAVREAEDATEEKLAVAARQAKRESDFLQSELADAAAAHEALQKEMQVGHSQALRDAQQQAEEQLAEAHKQAVQQRDEHQAALRELEQAHEARVAEAGKQLQQLKDEHQRMVEHAREQHHKALREVQQSEEHAWAEAAARVTTLREEHQAAMRKTERQAELRLDEANRRLEVVREELAQAETQRTRLAAAQEASEAALSAAKKEAADSHASLQHALSEGEKQRLAFQTKLTQLASQVAGKVAGLQGQYRTLCGEVESELSHARAECVASLEAAQLQAEQQAQAQASTIRRLKAQIAEQQQDLQAQHEAHARTVREVEVQRNAAENAQAKVAEQSKQLAAVTARASDAEAALAKRTKEAANVKGELDALHMALSEAHQRAQGLEASHMRKAHIAKEEVAKLRQEGKLDGGGPAQGMIGALEGRVAELVSVVDGKNKQLKAKEDELATAEAAQKALTNDVSAAQAAAHRAATELEETKRRLQVTQHDLAQARRKAEHASVNLARLEAEHEASKSALARTSSEAMQTGERSTQLEKRAKDLQGLLDKTAGELRDAQERARKREAAAADLQTQTSRLSAEVDAADTRTKRHQGEAAELQDRLKRTAQKLAEVEAEKQAIASAHTNLESHLTTVKKEAHGRVAQVTKDLGEVKADRQAKDRELSEASSEVAKANDACHRLKIKLNERKQAATALAAALASELGLPSDVQAALESQEAGQLSGVLGKLGSLVQAHADKHAVLNVLVPVEHALGLARQATSAGEGLAQIMGPLEDMLRSMGPNKLAKAAGLGRDPETGAPLSERVDKVLVECGARQATVSQLQLDLTRAREKIEAARKEGVQLAEEARAAAVGPLKAEVARLREASRELEAQFHRDTAGLRATLGQRESAARAEAQGAIEQLQASAATLQSQLASEEARSARLESEVMNLRESARRNLTSAPRTSSGTLPISAARGPRSSGTSGSPPQSSHAAGALGAPRASTGLQSGSYVPRASVGAPLTSVRASTNLAARGSNASMSSNSLRNLLQELEAEESTRFSSRRGT